MSFGPKDESMGNLAIVGAGGPVASTTSFGLPQSADDLRANFTALSIQTTPEQAQEVLTFIKNFSPTSNDYRLYSENCTTVCRDALKALGLVPQDNMNISPDAFWKTVFKLYAQNTAWNRFLKSVGQAPIYPGRDLGNPRFGMNTFDFVALQRQKACVTVQGATGPITQCQ
jgi:hypothetical protein